MFRGALWVHTCCAVDRFKAIAAGVRRSAFFSGVVSPLLLLTSSSEASGRYALPPFFYRCDNGETLVSQVEYEDQLGTGKLLAVYPYSIEERQQVLWITKGRQYIAVGGQQYDCRPWNRKSYLDATESTLPFIKVPDADELRVYAQRFKATQYRCEGGYTVRLRVTDFRDAGRGDHGLMEVNDREQFGHYLSRGNSGSFNGKERSDPGLAFYWYVGREPPYPIKRNLVIKNEAFPCEMVQQ